VKGSTVAADHPNALPLIEAAERLGLSENALRLRIRRGLAAAHKRDGRWYVVVPDDVDQSGDQPADRSRLGGDESETSQATSRNRTDELIAGDHHDVDRDHDETGHDAAADAQDRPGREDAPAMGQESMIASWWRRLFGRG